MSVYNLDSDEFLISEHIEKDDDILLVTSRNLIFVLKNMFGKVKDTVKFPLNKIVVLKGKPNLELTKLVSSTHTVKIYFTNTSREFEFKNHADAKKFALSIEAAVKDYKKNNTPAKEKVNFGEVVAHKISGLVTSAKGVIPSFDREPIKVSKKCPGCGADLNGEKDSTVQCTFCKLETTL